MTVSAPWAATVTAPAAGAACPDIAVVFARGTGDPPGVGFVGKSFVNRLHWKTLGKSMSVYPVDYPANWNFGASASAGAVNANGQVQYLAAACPATKIVLGGMSQGAAVIDLITIGQRIIWFFRPAPLPDAIADHIAAVAVFGNPSRDHRQLGPLTEISPQYGNRTIDLCASGDPFCSTGQNLLAHWSYTWNGMTDKAATYVAQQILNPTT